jgi:hypothetical protein
VYAAVAWSATGLPLAAVKYKISWNSGNMPKVVIALRSRIRNVVGPCQTRSSRSNRHQMRHCSNQS